MALKHRNEESLDEFCLGVAIATCGARLLAPALFCDLVMHDSITGSSGMYFIFRAYARTDDRPMTLFLL